MKPRPHGQGKKWWEENFVIGCVQSGSTRMALTKSSTSQRCIHGRWVERWVPFGKREEIFIYRFCFWGFRGWEDSSSMSMFDWCFIRSKLCFPSFCPSPFFLGVCLFTFQYLFIGKWVGLCFNFVTLIYLIYFLQHQLYCYDDDESISYAIVRIYFSFKVSFAKSIHLGCSRVNRLSLITFEFLLNWVPSTIEL